MPFSILDLTISLRRSDGNVFCIGTLFECPTENRSKRPNNRLSIVLQPNMAILPPLEFSPAP
jgi:hypothetical protein